jgi:hypothetical protein
MGQQRGEAPADWLARLKAMDAATRRRLLSRHRLCVAMAERAARLAAGKRPRKPRTIAEQIAAGPRIEGAPETSKAEGRPRLSRRSGA